MTGMAQRWHPFQKMGILKGYEDGTFRPNAPITRAGIWRDRYEILRRNWRDLRTRNVHGCNW